MSTASGKWQEAAKNTSFGKYRINAPFCPGSIAQGSGCPELATFTKRIRKRKRLKSPIFWFNLGAAFTAKWGCCPFPTPIKVDTINRLLLSAFHSLLIALSIALSAHAEYRPNHKDSGWVRLFNGKDLSGLYPYVEGSAKGQNPGNIVTVHDSMIHFYQGRKRANKDAGTGGVLSTELEFGYYRARVEYRAGEFTNDGWLTGDPWNSGMFFHANAGVPPFPQAIECQLRVHLTSNGKPCSVAAGDCSQAWAGDFWILTGAQIINKDGMATQLGGCCQPAPGNHKPDHEQDGWNTMEVEVFGDSLFRTILNGNEVNRGTKATACR
jgi:hypothetical protein